jgi:rhodanese-related sulfurtransferase
VSNTTHMSAIDELIARTRRRISQVDAHAVATLSSAGALLVDTRPIGQRREFGRIPGAITIERNQLEWRLDPTSAHRHPAAVDHTGPIVVFCQQGYSSILAVASLDDIGVRDVHDLAGGFEAWAAAGLPIEPESPT